MDGVESASEQAAQFDNEAMCLLLDHGEFPLDIVWVDHESILYVCAEGARTAWTHERHIPRKQNGKRVGEIVQTFIHVEHGFVACESDWYEEDAA